MRQKDLQDALRAEILNVLDRPSAKSALPALIKAIKEIEMMAITRYLGVWHWKSQAGGDRLLRTRQAEKREEKARATR